MAVLSSADFPAECVLHNPALLLQSSSYEVKDFKKNYIISGSAPDFSCPSHLLLIPTHPFTSLSPLFRLLSCPSRPVHSNRLLIFHLLTKEPVLLHFTHDISCPLPAAGMLSLHVSTSADTHMLTHLSHTHNKYGFSELWQLKSRRSDRDYK